MERRHLGSIVFRYLGQEGSAALVSFLAVRSQAHTEVCV